MPLWYHKTDSFRWINGSIRQDLVPDERSVWADFMALAGLSREPRRGYIERSEGIPYPKEVLLAMLNVTEELFDRAVDKCVTEGRLQVFPDGTYYLTNWEKYNNVAEFEAKKRQKSIANEKARKDRTSMATAAEALTREINRLNKEFQRVDKKLVYIATDDGKILNTKTGEKFSPGGEE